MRLSLLIALLGLAAAASCPLPAEEQRMAHDVDREAEPRRSPCSNGW